MPEVLNTANISELTDGMNFETELYKSKKTKSKKEEKVKRGKMESLLRRLFHLKLKSSTKSLIDSAKNNKFGKKGKGKKEKKQKKKAVPFEQERLEASWNGITRKESKEFHKMDRIAKFKLSKIIPSDLSKKRFQDLVVPSDLAPNSLKRIFQYVAYGVKMDLISESIPSQQTNYRPLTFPPQFINKGPEGKKKYPVDGNDWKAVNLMIFQNLANLLYGISLDFCNPACCPLMTIGKDYEYMWCDGITFLTPISVPARTYMKFCLLWTQKQLKDPQTITSSPDSIYPADIETKWKMMYRRLLRVYAHLAVNHHDDFDRIGVMGGVMSCMLRRFVLFGIESGLTSKKDLEPVKTAFKKIQREFRLNAAYE